SNQSVATVKNGNVVGKQAGTALITAEANRIKASCSVEVTNTTATIKEEIITLYCQNDTTQKKWPLVAKSKQLHASGDVFWNSLSPEVIAVDDGLITIQPNAEQSTQWKGYGATYYVTVRQMTAGSEVGDTCKVIVQKSTTQISTISGADKRFTLRTKGTDKTTTLQCNVVGENTTVKWKSNSPSIASVNAKGKVTAKKAGTALIYATANGITDSIRVTVKNYEPTIKLDKTSYVLYTGTKGNTVTLKATIDGPNKKATWDCLDSDVVTVSSKGKITALEEGTATITATANGVTASCQMIVKTPKTVLAKETLILKEQDTTFLPIDVIGNNQTVKWKSTDNSVVSVKNGAITAKKCGEADIQATANGITAICHVIVSDCTHIFDEGIVTTESTCTKKGTRLYTCTSCGATYEKEIALKAHTYNTGVITRESTCSEKGEIVYSCISCDKTRKKFLTYAPHSYVESVTKEPTCEQEGTLNTTCSVCSYSFETSIDHLDHIMGELETLTAATCSTTGKGKTTCILCGVYEEYLTLAIDPNNHVTEESVCIFKAPTEEEPLIGGEYVMTPRWRDDGAESDDVAFPLKKYTIDDVIGCTYNGKECFKIEEPVTQKLICSSCDTIVKTREHTHYLTSHVSSKYDISVTGAYCIDETCCYRTTVWNPVFNFLSLSRTFHLSRIKNGMAQNNDYHIKKGDTVEMKLYPIWDDEVNIDSLMPSSSYWNVNWSDKTLDPDFNPTDAFFDFTKKYKGQTLPLVPVVRIENRQVWGPYYTDEDGDQHRTGYTDYEIIAIDDTETLQKNGVEISTDPITKITTVTITEAFNTAKEDTWYPESVQIQFGYAYLMNSEGNLITEDLLCFRYIEDLTQWEIWVEKDAIINEDDSISETTNPEVSTSENEEAFLTEDDIQNDSESETSEDRQDTNSVSDNDSVPEADAVSGNEVAPEDENVSGNEVAPETEDVSGNNASPAIENVSGNDASPVIENVSGNEASLINNSTLIF
ncbi:MAG: Ig-like domain-containing protein, partial [Lachnospiraceae bacterium]|nr:Ig-like domain-containing protein [Lachnospiraceae bacterium]